MTPILSSPLTTHHSPLTTPVPGSGQPRPRRSQGQAPARTAVRLLPPRRSAEATAAPATAATPPQPRSSVRNRDALRAVARLAALPADGAAPPASPPSAMSSIHQVE